MATADGCEEGGGGEDVFVGCEQALLGADAEGYDGRGQIAVETSTSVNQQYEREWIWVLTSRRKDSLASSTWTCLFSLQL